MVLNSVGIDLIVYLCRDAIDRLSDLCRDGEFRCVFCHSSNGLLLSFSYTPLVRVCLRTNAAECTY